MVKESEAWDWNKSQYDSGVVPTPELSSEVVLERLEDESDSEDPEDSEEELEEDDPDTDDDP